MKTCICYSIDYVSQLDSYLPSAYIVEDRNGQLGYMQKLAHPEVLESYAIDWKDTDHEKILELIASLQPDQLKAPFQKGQKKLSLDKLFQDDIVKKTLQKKIHAKLGEIFNLISLNEFPLCDQIERKIVLEQIRVNTKVKEAVPTLYFSKTQTGLNYKLALTIEDELILPSLHDVKILTNDEGWMLVDYQLIKLSSINGNKIKPFLKKEQVFIPDRIQKDYFEKFIKDIIGKVESHVEGFSVEQVKEVPVCKLNFVEDLMSGKIMLSPVFHYGNTEFRFFDKSEQRVRITFKDGPFVTIIKRDLTAENQLLDQLTKAGLSFNNGLFFEDSDDKYGIYNWVSSHREDIEGLGYIFRTPMLNQKNISLDKYNMDFSFAKNRDWFDLHAIIKVGKQELIFADLISHIANENRFYELRDGTIFIIPDAWMKKYESIARFSKIVNGKVQISNSQYTLLEDFENKNTSSSKVYNVVKDDFEYIVSDKLKAKLRPYQYEGAKWLVSHYKNNFGSLLADDMGLGKTIQTLAVLLHAKEELKKEDSPKENQQLSLFSTTYENEIQPLRALIILPASLVFNWAEEIQKFAPSFLLTVYKGAKRHRTRVENFDVILTTYQTAAKDVDKLKRIEFSYIILDESHYIKNRNTKLFTNINQLNCKHKISLSGTPIENSLSDLYTQMEFINPDILGTYQFFKNHFQVPIEKNKNENALAELNKIIQPFILRRTKEEVLEDLPDIQEYVIYSEMDKTHKQLYDEEKSAARNTLLGIDEGSGQYKFHVFNLLLRLRKLANHPKLIDEESKLGSAKYNDVCSYLDTIIKANKKVLVFSSFLSQIDIYKRYCDEIGTGYEVLTGKTAVNTRAKVIERFKTQSQKQVFFISLKAGGVGLNLTEAHYVIILDPWWNPFAERQAIGRSHRMGQKEKVMVTRFITKDTVEDKILKLQQEKLSIAGDIVDLGDQPDINSTSIDFLLG